MLYDPKKDETPRVEEDFQRFELRTGDELPAHREEK